MVKGMCGFPMMRSPIRLHFLVIMQAFLPAMRLENCNSSPLTTRCTSMAH